MAHWCKHIPFCRAFSGYFARNASFDEMDNLYSQMRANREEKDILEMGGIFDMRIILGFVIVLVSLALSSAGSTSGPEHVVARHIHCCMSDGQCLKARRHHCEKKGGRVVGSCEQCKAQWEPGEPEK